jgi:hypothetical protein
MGTFEAQSSYRKAWSTGRLWVPSMWGWGHDPMCFLCGKILSKAIRLLILIYLWSDGLTMIDYYFINKLNWIMKKHKCETIVIRFSCVFIPMLRTWPEDPGQHLQPYERNYFAWAAGCQWGCAGAGDIGQRTGTCGLQVELLVKQMHYLKLRNLVPEPCKWLVAWPHSRPHVRDLDLDPMVEYTFLCFVFKLQVVNIVINIAKHKDHMISSGLGFRVITTNAFVK